MESAGLAALAALRSSSRVRSQRLTKVLFLIGPGHNGADAWVLLRLLLQHEVVVCEIFCPAEGKSEIWQKQKSKVERSAYRQIDIVEVLDKAGSGQDWNLIVDGVFGTGISRNVDESWQNVFEALRHSRAFKMSLDLPSGLNADTGHVMGSAFKANLTVTFGASKPGLHLMDGPGLAGQVVIDAIDFPVPLLRSIAAQSPRLRAFGQNAARAILPRRELTGHKGTYGHCLLLCGSEKYRGAGILTAEAALRTGPGYVHLAAEDEIYPETLKLPEVIYFDRQDFFKRDFDTQKTSVVLGPGLLDHDFLEEALQFLLKKKFAKVVLDAEALNVLALMKNPAPLPKTWIMTPHPGELGRLMKVSSEEINSDRIRWAKQAQQKWQSIILLKGFRTVVATEKRCTIVLSGNSSLAKAGSGDVLSGMMGGFSAQMKNPEEAALLSAYVHGRIATLHVQAGGDPASLIASDLIRRLDPIIAGIRRSRT